MSTGPSHHDVEATSHRDAEAASHHEASSELPNDIRYVDASNMAELALSDPFPARVVLGVVRRRCVVYVDEQCVRESAAKVIVDLQLDNYGNVLFLFTPYTVSRRRHRVCEQVGERVAAVYCVRGYDMYPRAAVHDLTRIVFHSVGPLQSLPKEWSDETNNILSARSYSELTVEARRWIAAVMAHFLSGPGSLFEPAGAIAQFEMFWRAAAGGPCTRDALGAVDSF